MRKKKKPKVSKPRVKKPNSLEASIHIRVTMALKNRLKEEAEKEFLRFSTYIRRLLQKSLVHGVTQNIQHISTLPPPPNPMAAEYDRAREEHKKTKAEIDNESRTIGMDVVIDELKAKLKSGKVLKPINNAELKDYQARKKERLENVRLLQ